MTRALAITKRQVRALIEGAKDTGYAPVVQIGNVIVRLIPENHAINPQNDRPIADAADDTEALDRELLAFEARHAND